MSARPDTPPSTPTSHPTAGTTLSEAASKEVVADYGLPVPREIVADTPTSAVAAANEIGYPVVMKLVGDNIAHKTERGLVRLNIAEDAAANANASELLDAAVDADGEVAVLVAPMVSGNRELIVGILRDPQFGPQVMLGVGGVLAEAVGDVAFSPVPLTTTGAEDLIDALTSQAVLGPTRGDAAVDRSQLISILVALSDLAIDRPEIVSMDINPLIVQPDGRLVAVDALIEIADNEGSERAVVSQYSDAQFNALFEPRGVVVTGASTHPGKFGFVALHNLLASGYSGAVFATNLKQETVLGIETIASLEELPAGVVDLVVVCTPAQANLDILRAAAAKGIRAAFVTSAGYGESDETGRRAQDELVALAGELGILLAGPNGQGVVSTPAQLCAQIVAPYPPTGSIGVASQSGNFVSSFLNLATWSGVGVSRAVSAGNAAAVTVADYLRFYADDPATTVGLAYLEGIEDGRSLMAKLGEAAARKPLVLLKGGATEGGAHAAASHTGALAANDVVFDGECRARGITRASSVLEAYTAAATFATQPLPKGDRVAVLTTAGGWGVVTADAITRHRDLRLAELPDDLMAAIDEYLPARWSRNNPVDCAGGETRDTIPTVMRLLAEHEAIDAVIYLGIGIQSNQARMMREGRFYPGDGLERIVSYHERQDERFADAASTLSASTGKPILVATELALTDPSNAAPAAVRSSGRLCYTSGEQAVTALGHLVRYSRFVANRV